MSPVMGLPQRSIIAPGLPVCNISGSSMESVERHYQNIVISISQGQMSVR